MARRKAGSNLQTVDELRNQLQRRAEAQSKIVSEKTGNWVSTKGQRFTYRGEVLESPLPVILLSYAQDYAYYEGGYDPDEYRPPTCAALSRAHIRDLRPLPNVPNPQSEQCYGCRQNEFGTARVGKGKACKNQWRLAFVHAEDPEGDIAMMRVSPSGYPDFEAYVNKCHSKYKVGPEGVFSLISFVPNMDFPVVHVEEREAISQAAVLNIIVKRLEEAEEMLLGSAYQFEEAPKPRSAKKKAAKKRAAAR